MTERETIIKDSIYDLIVIGGGITGAGVARDAALRGLSCLLLEKDDFASGASSKSTRLIHGGLRYLANFELDLVAESLRERAVLRRQAPYLVRPMPILIPIYRDDPHGKAAISIGVRFYDLLTREKDIPHYSIANKDKTLSFGQRKLYAIKGVIPRMKAPVAARATGSLCGWAFHLDRRSGRRTRRMKRAIGTTSQKNDSNRVSRASPRLKLPAMRKRRRPEVR